MSKIDVLMTVYNCGHYIEEALTSIQNQTLNDIRIIIVNDGSTDQTEDIILQKKNTDPRIEYYKQNNKGIVAALQNGLQYCTAPFIARHDGDDISLPTRFEKQVEYLEQNRDCAAVSSYVKNILSDGTPEDKPVYTFPLENIDPYTFPASEPYISQPMLMLRASVFHQAGGYRSLRSAEDTDLYWRLRHFGRLHVIPEILGKYRVHQQSTTSGSLSSLRQSTFWSELAALSEQRRLEGRPDFSFSTENLERFRSLQTWDHLMQSIAPELNTKEKRWLSHACAAKYAEFLKTRRFIPERGDIQFWARNLTGDKELSEILTMTLLHLWQHAHKNAALSLALQAGSPAAALKFLKRLRSSKKLKDSATPLPA
ncbi:glycosyltransferase family 2 protein [Acetobacter sp.]|uniref:glycosyltransferase family 2 protein n=1 Tax=Acetobacter sp. TaxID=440 RepID=UPI0039EC8D81